MAKITGKMGKVTYTSGNGEVINFTPNQVDYSYNSGLVDINVSGTYDQSVLHYPTKPDELLVSSYELGNSLVANIAINDRDFNDSLTIATDKLNTALPTYGYINCKEQSKMKLNMTWLKPNDLLQEMAGLLFLYENRGSIFGKEKDVIASIHATVVNGKIARALEPNNYAGGILVTGWQVPAANHPLINHPLVPAVHHRGTVAQNNPRTIYEYMSDETYGMGIYVGLTVHDILGSWSSWPVHEYEVNALTAPLTLYPEFSEKFAFITNPVGSWGLQARAQANGDKSVVRFKDGDIIDIPLGAHPNVAAPATRLAYLWAYTGAPRKDF